MQSMAGLVAAALLFVVPSVCFGQSTVVAGEVTSGTTFEKPFGPGLRLRVELLGGANDTQHGVYVSLINPTYPNAHQFVLLPELVGGEESNFIGTFAGPRDPPAIVTERLRFTLDRLKYFSESGAGVELTYFTGTFNETQLQQIEEANLTLGHHGEPDEVYARARAVIDPLQKFKAQFRILDYRLSADPAVPGAMRISYLKFSFEQPLIPREALINKIAKDADCEMSQVRLDHVETFDFTGDGKDEAVVVASTCMTGTAGPDVHSVFSLDASGALVELKIMDIDSKRYNVLFGNRNSTMTVQRGLLVETAHDGTNRPVPLVISYKWNGREFTPVSVVTSPRYKTSYDCSKAVKEMERAVCYVKTLADLDLELNRAYQSLLRTLAPAEKETLRVEQRQWLADREKQYIYKSTDSLEEFYRTRIEALEQR